MILVTKEGKLVTVDFDAKTKATQIDPTPAKIGEVGLGSSAVVQYTKEPEIRMLRRVSNSKRQRVSDRQKAEDLNYTGT